MRELFTMRFHSKATRYWWARLTRRVRDPLTLMVRIANARPDDVVWFGHGWLWVHRDCVHGALEASPLLGLWSHRGPWLAPDPGWAHQTGPDHYENLACWLCRGDAP